MLPNLYSQLNNYPQWNQWQNMSNQPFADNPWQKNWRGRSYGPMPRQPYPIPYTHYPTPMVYQMLYPMQPAQRNAPQTQNQPL